MEATKLLQEAGLSNVFFHQLDVRDPQSIELLAKFITTEFKRLDILVNNAGAQGVVVDEDGLKNLNIETTPELAGKSIIKILDVAKTTYEMAKEGLDTPFLLGSKNIMSISSEAGELSHVPNEQIRKQLGDIDTLTEEKIDGILEKFLHDVQEDALEANGWQTMFPAYIISKATLTAYTRKTEE